MYAILSTCSFVLHYYSLFLEATHPKFFVSGHVDFTAPLQHNPLVLPRSGEMGSLPHPDAAPRLETEIDAIGGAPDDGRIVGPAVARARAWVFIAGDSGYRGQHRRQAGQEAPNEHSWAKASGMSQCRKRKG